MAKKKWYASWFDTTYYHKLYKNRDYAEAQLFLDNLVEVLEPKKGARLLDLACGKGRHSIYLASKDLGLDITGVDLSVQSIKHAQKSETKTLSFFPHDMRQVFKKNHFDYIINVFTSFGYFENDQDNDDTLMNVTKGLRKNGTFVMDFFNAHKVIANLKPRQQKTVDGICFKITRKVENGFIVKRIRFSDKGKDFEFEERVRAFTLTDYKKLFKKAGLEIVEKYGDYDLKPYRKKTSDRLILIARREGDVAEE